ncbi:MAG: zf-HC2 domain-containing protein, partial [Bacteroidetes bacterium]|nr:zf-HC2 domain-containing protein [Bacteroidota bacterium]
MKKTFLSNSPFKNDMGASKTIGYLRVSTAGQDLEMAVVAIVLGEEIRDLLPAYMLGTATAHEIGAVEDHLSVCEL